MLPQGKQRAGSRAKRWRLLALALALVVVAGLIWAIRRFGWDELAAHQAAILEWVHANRALAAGAFLLAYLLAAALSLPEAALLTVLSGVLFGTLPGALLSLAGSTAGAAVLVLLLRGLLGPLLERQRARIPKGVRLRLARDGFLYLLALRLLPILPFWLVNLAAALAGLRLGVFISATLIGALPGSLVFASIGNGFGGVVAQGRPPDLSILFTPRILLPLLALAGLSLLPILLRGRLAPADTDA